MNEDDLTWKSVSNLQNTLFNFRQSFENAKFICLDDTRKETFELARRKTMSNVNITLNNNYI